MENEDLIFGYIYMIISPNDKIYIGQTTNLKNRKRKYKNFDFKGQIKLWNNCKKYDWNPMDTFLIIEEVMCDKTKSLLNEREKYWILYYNCFLNGLNCTAGGDGKLSVPLSPEHKEKLRIANLGKKHSEETKKKLSIARKGNIKSEETRKKLSLALKGKPISEKNRLKRLENPYIFTDEHKNNISKGSMGNKNHLGKKHSEETKKSISDKKKGLKPVNRKKVICINTGIVYESTSEAAKLLNLQQSKISLVCNGKRKSTGGLEFKFFIDE